MKPKITSSHPFEGLLQTIQIGEITGAQLQLAKDFTTLPLRTTLTVQDSTLPEFSISAFESSLRIRIHHRITLPHGLLKFPVRAICDALTKATGLAPNHAGPNDPPKVSLAWCPRPDAVSWVFDLPLETSGEMLIEAVRASNAFVWMHAEGILTSKQAR